MYKKGIKRVIDFTLSLIALIILSPLILILTIIGILVLKGNPFFVQLRPGKNEKIFKLIKFRSMSNKKDLNGNLLPDEKRLGKYGRFLRLTSLDELPELFNILKGDMSIVGPRPLLPEYLSYYTEKEKHRHDVRPGLTGLAQVSGRNYLSWEQKFDFDLEYVENISFMYDIKIIFKTIKNVLICKNIEDPTLTYVDENNNEYVMADGKKISIHKPLNIEREEKNNKISQ